MSKNHPSGGMRTIALDEKLANIDARIKELQQMRKDFETSQSKRDTLLAYVQKGEYERPDVAWVYNQLPPAHITRKMRENRYNAHIKSTMPSKTNASGRKPRQMFTPDLIQKIVQARTGGMKIEKIADLYDLSRSATQRMLSRHGLQKNKPTRVKGKKVREEYLPFAKWLAEHRAKLKLNRREMAEKLKVHQSMVSAWEAGYWYPIPERAAAMEKLFEDKIPSSTAQ